MTPKQIKLNRESVELVAAKVKLTTKQKEVVRAIRAGAIVRKDSSNDYHIIIQGNGMTSKVTSIIIDDLIRKGMLERRYAMLKSIYYALSDLGKNLKID